MKTISLHPATPSQRRLTAWTGMLAPLLFVLVFTLEGSLRPGYSPLSTYVSALSLGPRGWIQIANFLLFGALLFGFTRGLAAEFPTGKASRWGLILMTVIAGLYFISGPFVMDPMNTPVDQATWHGIIHGLAGGIAFILMPISCFIYLRRFRADPNWNFLSGWTLALGTLVAVVVVAFSIISKSTELSLQFKDHLGLIQRGLIIPYMFWLFLFAFGLLRRSQ